MSLQRKEKFQELSLGIRIRFKELSKLSVTYNF